MFLGHFAVGFVAKRVAPRTSLTTLMVAATLLDILWPIFLVLGLEQVRIVPDGPTPFERLDFISYPWSHSAFMAVLWAALFGFVYYAVRRSDVIGAYVVGLAVFSHWVLDWVTHLPDLPLAINAASPKVGLGMWDSTAATIVVELILFTYGLAQYVESTRARNWQGHVSLWSIVGLLALAYYGDIVGPAPPSVQALEIVGVVGSLLTLWFVWVDKTRTPRAPA